MRTSLPKILVIFILAGVTPVVALAATCRDYPLSQAQLDYLEGQQLAIEIPQGDVPIIQRCDIDGNNTVDINDIRAISMNRNQPAAHPDDPMDWDRNNVINLLDARGCQLACTLPRCAVQNGEPPEHLVGGGTAPAECFQAEDFDGDGKGDFAGVYEHAGDEPRGGTWGLEVVILNDDEEGNVQHVRFPYSGRISETTGELRQHLSLQPAGVVNLNPGTLTIDKPALVSYRDGEPKVIYYFQDGQLNRAFYGIDD